MKRDPSVFFTTRVKAILAALLVVILWSTSWILIKIAITEVPPLTLAGLRYTLGFMVLTPFILRNVKNGSEVIRIKKSQWLDLAILGIVYIALTQGAMYIALSKLSAVSTNLILHFSSAIVAISGIFFLHEKPTRMQWFGLIINISGIMIYFMPFQFESLAVIGYVAAIFCLLSNSLSVLLSRRINRDRKISPLLVSWGSIGVGGIVLLVAGLIIQGLPYLSLQNIIIILWLGIVNTAMTFPLWNYSLQSLTAIESSLINSLLLIFITILAVIFLGEQLEWIDILGLSLAGLGTVLVQLNRSFGINR